jgi:hypothetical protein
VKPVALLLVACSVAAGAETPDKGIKIQQRMIVLEGDSSKLKVNELYTVEYNPVPPNAKKPQRTLEIYLPGGAVIEQAAVRTTGNMPLKTSIVPQAEKNLYAFTYQLRPGKTQFTVTYTLPYSGQLKVVPRVTGVTAELMLVMPNSMSLAPEHDSVFARANDPMLKDVNVFVASGVTSRQNLGFEVRGAGTLARAAPKEGQAAPQDSQPAEASRRRGEGGTQDQESAGRVPAQWVFLAVLFLFLAAAVTYVYSVNHAPPPVPASPAPDSVLTALKEEMFQLESDRLGGKLSPEEYAAAKTVLDKALRKAIERAGNS